MTDIQVVDIQVQEDGSSVIQFTTDQKAAEVLTSTGFKFLLYCHLLDMSANEVFELLWSTKDAKQV